MHEQQTVALPQEGLVEQPDELKDELRQLFYLYFQKCDPDERERIQQNMEGITRTSKRKADKSMSGKAQIRGNRERYRKYIHGYDNAAFDAIPEERDNGNQEGTTDEDVFYLNFSSNVSRTTDTATPGPSTTSAPASTSLSVPGSSSTSVPGPSRKVVEEELQGLGGKSSGVRIPGPINERYISSHGTFQPDFRDNSCSLRKLKCALIIILSVLLLGGIIAWLTVLTLRIYEEKSDNDTQGCLQLIHLLSASVTSKITLNKTEDSEKYVTSSQSLMTEIKMKDSIEIMDLHQDIIKFQEEVRSVQGLIKDQLNHAAAIIRLQQSISKLDGEMNTAHHTIMELNNKTSAIRELRTILNGFHNEVNANQSIIKHQISADTGILMTDIKHLMNDVGLLRKDVEAIDIDECITNTHHCHAEAFCYNTMGSYNCSCRAGYTGNGYNCTLIGSTQDNPGKSCIHLKEMNGELKSGLFWVQMDEPVLMYCDMETNGGGWTMVGMAKLEKEQQSSEVNFAKLLSNDVHRLHEVSTTNRFLLGVKGLNNLHKHISFKQLRFFCTKPWHGRTLHFRTSDNQLGIAVRDYMLGNISYANRPASCESYIRYPDDNSNIGMYCSRWGEKKWDQPNMYNHAFYITYNNRFDVFALEGRRIECDDHVDYDQPNFRTVGRWEFYVR